MASYRWCPVVTGLARRYPSGRTSLAPGSAWSPYSPSRTGCAFALEAFFLAGATRRVPLKATAFMRFGLFLAPAIWLGRLTARHLGGHVANAHARLPRRENSSADLGMRTKLSATSQLHRPDFRRMLRSSAHIRHASPEIHIAAGRRH
jgi:hypothetical protein